jgi:hypothetical protein
MEIAIEDGKGQIHRRGDDPYSGIGFGIRRRQHERALRQIHFPRQGLHRFSIETARVRENGESVTGQSAVSEDVAQLVR